MILPRLVIVILNWNGWEDTVECLESLFQINYPNYNVIVVDNASEDDSIEKIKNYAGGIQRLESNYFLYDSSNKPLKMFEYTNEESELLPINESSNTEFILTQNLILLKNNKNYGFAEGNNIGIRFALKNLDPQYVLLLNNDTVVDKNFLVKLVEFAENNSVIGVIGPKILYYDTPDKFQVTSTEINFWRGTSYLIGDGEIDHGQYDKIKKTDYVPGSCFLAKREVIDKVGLFNSDYYLYWEEADYCMRANKLGYKCIYYPHTKIWHKASNSTNKVSGLLTYYMTRNMFWFMKEHADRLHNVMFILFFVGLKFWYVNINFLYKKRYENIPFFLKGIKDGVK